MKEHYSILAELKQIDDKLGRVKRDIDSVPQEIQKIETSLAGTQAEFDKAKSSFDAFEKNLRKAESDLKEKEDHLRKAEAKMMEVKTNEEYQAASKENEAQKKVKTLIEEQILGLMNDLETQKTAFAAANEKFKETQSKLVTEKSKLQEESAKLQAIFDEIVAKRNSVCAKLPPDVSDLYKRVSLRFKGVDAVAIVDGGKCLSCNMTVRAQLYNEVLGFKAVHQCPSCARIMVVAANMNLFSDSSAEK